MNDNIFETKQITFRTMTSPPYSIGDIYYDTSCSKVYMATSISSLEEIADNSSITLSSPSSNISGYTTTSSGSASATWNNGTVYTSPGYYTTTGYSSWSSDLEVNEVTIDSAIKKKIEEFLSSEGEMMPLIEKFLVEYLENILEDPDKVVEKLLKNRDIELQILRGKVDMLEWEKTQLTTSKEKLEKDLESMKSRLDYLETIINNPNHQYPWSPWGGNGGITWTTTCDGTDSSAATYTATYRDGSCSSASI